jgi:succinate-acetate transporter protein
MAASGDPQVLAAPVFVIGSIALALQLTQYVSPAALGTPLAIIMGCTALYLIISTIWAASAGQSFVASFAGTFGAFWASYSILVLALLHNWFLIPAADVQRTVAIFAIAFAAFFFVMTIVALRLPAIYPAIIGLVTLALCLVAASYLKTPVDLDLLKVAGYIVFIFAGLGMSVSWTVLNLSLGGPVFPPLGPVLQKPKAAA